MTNFIGTDAIYFLSALAIFFGLFFIGIILVVNSHFNKVDSKIKIIEDKLKSTEHSTVLLYKEIRDLIKTIKN